MDIILKERYDEAIIFDILCDIIVLVLRENLADAIPSFFDIKKSNKEVLDEAFAFIQSKTQTTKQNLRTFLNNRFKEIENYNEEYGR